MGGPATGYVYPHFLARVHRLCSGHAFLSSYSSCPNHAVKIQKSAVKTEKIVQLTTVNRYTVRVGVHIRRRSMTFLSMSVVFPILHISFTAILPAITLFCDYKSCLHGSICTPNRRLKLGILYPSNMGYIQFFPAIALAGFCTPLLNMRRRPCVGVCSTA